MALAILCTVFPLSERWSRPRVASPQQLKFTNSCYQNPKSWFWKLFPWPSISIVVLLYSHRHQDPTPQRSNTARVCNMSRFDGDKLPGNSEHCFKKSKDKAVPRKRRFRRSVSMEKCLVLSFVTVFRAQLFYELRSANALN